MKLNNVIGIVAFLACVGLFVATNSAAALGLALTSLAMPALGILASRVSAARSRLSCHLQSAVVVGQDLSLEIEVSRPPLFRGRIDLAIECRNVLTGLVEELPVSLAPAMGRIERFTLPLSSARCGKVDVELTRAITTDIFGFKETPIARAAFKSSCTVYPVVADIEVQTARAVSASVSGASYDLHRRGQDNTEVLEMREYRDGDSLKAVHWKLSARFGDLVVREPSRPTDFDIVLIVDANPAGVINAAQAEVVNATMTVAASISLALARQGLGHMVARAHGDSDFGTVLVDGRASFDAMLDVLMATPLSVEPLAKTAPFEAYSRLYHVTKAVLITNRADEGIFASLASCVDLSVFQVSSEDFSGLDMAGSYLLTHVSAGAVAERVKNLEL